METGTQELLEAGVQFTVVDEFALKERIRHMVSRAERTAETKVRKGLMSWEAFMALPKVLTKRLRRELGVIPGYNPDIPLNTYEDERTALDEVMMPDPEPYVPKHHLPLSWKRMVKMACGQKAEVWRKSLSGWELVRVLVTLSHPMRKSDAVVGQWAVVPNHSLWVGWSEDYNLHIVHKHDEGVYRAVVAYDAKTKKCKVLREWQNDGKPASFLPELAVIR